jgi:hypothetical protein
VCEFNDLGANIMLPNELEEAVFIGTRGIDY